MLRTTRPRWLSMIRVRVTVARAPILEGAEARSLRIGHVRRGAVLKDGGGMRQVSLPELFAQERA